MPRINLWMRSPIFLYRLTRVIGILDRKNGLGLGSVALGRSEEPLSVSFARSPVPSGGLRVFPGNIPLHSLTAPPPSSICRCRPLFSKHARACPRATAALNEFNDGSRDY